MVAEPAGVHTLHLCLYFIQHCFEKDFSSERSRAHTHTQRHTREQLFCFTSGPFFFFIWNAAGLQGQFVSGADGSVEKKETIQHMSAVSGLWCMWLFRRFVLLFSVCRGWQQQCNSLSLACNRLIYLWHTILSDLHCVRCVTLTQTFTVTSRIILAAIPGEVLTWGSVCKQGCCICLISPVLKWRDSKNLTWLDFTCNAPTDGICGSLSLDKAASRPHAADVCGSS